MNCSNYFPTNRNLNSGLNAGVEIKNLEQHGLDRVLSYGKGGFARMVCLSVAAANVHRLIFQKQGRKKGGTQAATRAA